MIQYFYFFLKQICSSGTGSSIYNFMLYFVVNGNGRMHEFTYMPYLLACLFT